MTYIILMGVVDAMIMIILMGLIVFLDSSWFFPFRLAAIQLSSNIIR